MTLLEKQAAVFGLRSHEKDIYAWSLVQAGLLRQKRFREVDLANVIEEIESVGRSERRALKSSCRLVTMHLLKWRYQPERRTASWSDAIGRERANIAQDEHDSPSLAERAEELVAEVYAAAMPDAADETGLPLQAFPTGCPYPIDFLRNRDAMPE